MIHVTNWKYADIGTGVAAAAMSQQGLVCKVTDDGAGRRLLTPILDTEDALVLAGNYAVALKVDTDPNEIDFANPDGLTVPGATRDRSVTIAADDLVMECRAGTKLEYSADLLDNSLNPAQGGTTPTVGQDLGISGSKWATIAAATSAGIATPVVGRVHKVFGTSVVVELVY